MIQRKAEDEFFVVVDNDTGEAWAFHAWEEMISFLTDEVMEYDIQIILVELGIWRAPKNREECYNTLLAMPTVYDLNDALEEFYSIYKVRFWS